MRRLAALSLVLLVAGPGWPTAAQQTITRPWPGITYIERAEAQPRATRMHIVQVDLSQPGIRMRLSPPRGAKEVTRQTTLEFLKEQGAQLAVNVHFFWPFPSPDQDVEVIGIAASDGRVYSGFESPIQSYALVTNAPGINIDAENRAALVHRNASTTDPTRVAEPVTLWTTVSGSAQIVTDGRVTVPTYRDPTHPDGALTPGGVAQYSNDRSWYDVATARTALAISRDSRTLTIFTVDARGGSMGMTVREVAALLVSDYGAWHALNLDGGGSTTLAMQDPQTGLASIVNTSSDNPLGRAVGSSLAIFAVRP